MARPREKINGTCSDWEKIAVQEEVEYTVPIKVGEIFLRKISESRTKSVHSLENSWLCLKARNPPFQADQSPLRKSTSLKVTQI